MNIRRIIREEMDDLQWIKDIDPNEELYEPWVIRAIELMEDTPYYFDENIKRQLGLLKRHTRSKNIIEDAIMVIFKRILLRRIGEYASFPGSYEDFKKEDKKFLEGYELLKKSIQPKIYNRMLKNLKEQDELEWIKDVQSNQDIAQEIADKSEIKDNKLSHPFSPFPSPFLLLSLSSYPFFSFKKYCKEQYGLIEEDLQDVWNRYKDIITDKINKHNNLNESSELDWIKNVNDPWENINPKLISQLTNEESDLIEASFESDKHEHGYYGCDPIYKITGVAFEENSDYVEEVVIPFEVTCEEGSLKGTNYITLWINRDTLEWNMA